jgi:hypothetical protein
MAYNYDPDDKFGYKDKLPENNPEKVITGVEFDDEFKKIESGMVDLQVEIDAIINSGAITEAPDDGYTYGRNSMTWVPVADKDHDHELSEVNNLVTTLNYLQSQIDSIEEGAIDPDHHHEITDVDGLQTELNKLNAAIQGITSNLVFGGTYSLANDLVMRSLKEDEGLMEGQPLPPNGTVFDTFLILLDGGTFAGESMARGDWIVADATGTWLPIPYSTAGAVDWGNITGKPSTYPPGPHNHDGVYQPVGDYLTDAPVNDSQYVRQGGAWVPNDGTVGPEGPTGPEGDKGETGDKGDNGVDGKGWTSGAYNASNGVVTFTSDDGLGFVTGDLRGTNGTDGTDGIDGESITGPAGPGWTGGTYDANTGFVTFTSDDGLGFSTTDIRGGQGIAGTDGKGWTDGYYDAADGKIKFLSDDGLGFETPDLRGADGGVGPQGPQGEKGEDSQVPGPTGPEGAQGPQGEKGNTGADSTVAGPQGPKGDTGANGGTGPQGPKGNDGANGTNGGTGATGPQGPAGGTGPTGPQGPQGPAGTAATPNTAGNGLSKSGNTFLMSGSYSGNLTATDFIASSDANKKKNIVTAQLGYIDSLRGVEFEWADTGEQASGVIAQEVQKVLPHLVHEGEDGLSVSYMGLIAYLIEEIKDLRRMIEENK